jgi:NADH-quinone oxidoreductase subunit L
MLTPLVILAIGAIFAGYFFKELFIGHSSSNYFWTDSIKFLIPLSSDHPPLWIIYITPIIVVLSIPFSYYLFVKNKSITNWLITENKPLYNFLVNKWYFDELYDYLFVKSSKKVGIFFWKNVDIKIIDKFGPDGISNLIKIFSNKAVKFQSGFIYQYAFIMLIGFSAILTYLILL